MKKWQYFVFWRVYSPCVEKLKYSFHYNLILCCNSHIFDEYTRHEEMAIFCVLTSTLAIRRKRNSFHYNLVLCCNNHIYSVFDEYTRHEEMVIFCVLTSTLAIRRKRNSFHYNLVLCCNSHIYSVFDEYTRHRLLFPILNILVTFNQLLKFY